MLIVVLIMGVILIVAAIRNTQGQLFSALGQDVPGFLVWGAAVFAVGALGFIPGLKGPARGLVALVLIVLVLRNYDAAIKGLSQAIAPDAGSNQKAVGS